MLKIGCHLSISKGYYAAAQEAFSIGANTFQFFTRNPRGSKAKAIASEDVEKFSQFAKENNFTKILGHAPYTLNAASPDEDKRGFALKTIADDLQRMEQIPNNLYNFHPGNHMGKGADAGIALIADALNCVLDAKQTTTVLLETMAGKGTEVGRSFEELRAILDKVQLVEKMGVCLDTCHVFDAGYDVVNDIDGVLEEFDRVIGLEKLCAVHLNDSMNALGSHKDRHAKIGEGKIGLTAISSIINHPALRHLPFILETPNDITGYQEEIAVLKGCIV